jgi:hypothetical protein
MYNLDRLPVVIFSAIALNIKCCVIYQKIIGRGSFIYKIKKLEQVHFIRNITCQYRIIINYRNDNYSYVKNVIYEYSGVNVFETRKQFMKYIDTEIMMINM